MPTDGEDLIRDFTPGTDRVVLDADAFGLTLPGGIISAGLFMSGAGLPGSFGLPGVPVFYFETTYRTRWVDATGGGSADAVAVASLEQGSLGASDIFLV